MEVLSSLLALQLTDKRSDSKFDSKSMTSLIQNPIRKYDSFVGDHTWVVVEAIKENDGFAECFLAKFQQNVWTWDVPAGHKQNEPASLHAINPGTSIMRRG